MRHEGGVEREASTLSCQLVRLSRRQPAEHLVPLVPCAFRLNLLYQAIQDRDKIVP